MKKQIQIRIFPDGSVKAETLGIKGEKCEDFVPVLEELLEAKAVDVKKTEEYYQSEIHLASKQYDHNHER